MRARTQAKVARTAVSPSWGSGDGDGDGVGTGNSLPLGFCACGRDGGEGDGQEERGDDGECRAVRVRAAGVLVATVRAEFMPGTRAGEHVMACATVMKMPSAAPGRAHEYDRGVVKLASVGLGVVLLLATSARADAIPPIMLWDLAEHADVIAVVDVEHKGSRRGFALPPEDTWLRVRTPLKGEVASGGVVLVPSTGGICPAPAELREGERALVFLSRDGTGYRVFGETYGIFYVDDALLAAMLERTMQALSLIARGATVDEKVEWHVQTAETPGLLKHGIYPLGLSRRFGEWLWPDERRAPLSDELTAEQRARLRSLFLKEPPRGWMLALLLEVLKDDASIEVTRAAIRAYEERDRELNASRKLDIVMRLRERLHEPVDDAAWRRHPVLSDAKVDALWETTKRRRVFGR